MDRLASTAVQHADAGIVVGLQEELRAFLDLIEGIADRAHDDAHAGHVTSTGTRAL